MEKNKEVLFSEDEMMQRMKTFIDKQADILEKRLKELKSKRLKNDVTAYV